MRLALTLLAAVAVPGLAESNPYAACDKTFSVPWSVKTALFWDHEENSTTPDADDSTVWYNAQSPEDSRIVGTLKNSGLGVFDLQGKTTQLVPCVTPSEAKSDCRMNNVQAVWSAKTGKQLIVVSERGLDLLKFYRMNEDTLKIEEVPYEGGTAPFVFSSDWEDVKKQESVYGLTTVRFEGKLYAFVSQRHQRNFAKVLITENDDGTVKYEVLKVVGLPLEHTLADGYKWSACVEVDSLPTTETPHMEGMVADPENDVLLVSQESVGLFQTKISDPSDPVLIDTTEIFGVEWSRHWDDEEQEYVCEYDGEDHGAAGNIHTDAEGMSLYNATDGSGFWILSSQDDARYELYDRKDPSIHIATMKIRNPNVDDDFTTKTDGVDVFTMPLGDEFPKGVLVVQDDLGGDDNYERDAHTGFKYVDVAEVLDWLAECRDDSAAGGLVVPIVAASAALLATLVW